VLPHRQMFPNGLLVASRKYSPTSGRYFSPAFWWA